MSEITRTMPGLNPNTRYVVRVRKYNAFNVQSEWSEALEFTTSDVDPTPEPPTDLDINWDGPDLILRWTPPTLNSNETVLEDLYGYRVVLTDNIQNEAAVTSREYFTATNSFVFTYPENRTYFNASYDIDVDIFSERPTGALSFNALSINALNDEPPDPDPDNFSVTTSQSGLQLQWSYREMPSDFLYFDVEASTISTGPWLEVASVNSLTHFHVPFEGSSIYYRYRIRDMFGRFSSYTDGIGPYTWVE